MPNFEAGDMIRFTYPRSKNDKFKQILVLHTSWKNKVHGLDLKLMTVAEREVLKIVMNPRNRGKRSRIPLANDILAKMDPPSLVVENPLTFYNQFVKRFINGRDLYRTYFPEAIMNVQIVDNRDVILTTSGPKQLFSRIGRGVKSLFGNIRARAKGLFGG